MSVLEARFRPVLRTSLPSTAKRWYSTRPPFTLYFTLPSTPTLPSSCPVWLLTPGVGRFDIHFRFLARRLKGNVERQLQARCDRHVVEYFCGEVGSGNGERVGSGGNVRKRINALVATLRRELPAGPGELRFRADNNGLAWVRNRPSDGCFAASCLLRWLFLGRNSSGLVLCTRRFQLNVKRQVLSWGQVDVLDDLFADVKSRD